MEDLIVKFKQKLKKQKLKGLALDIDETLSRTHWYWFENMQIKFGNPENLGIAEMIAKYRYTENVPYWQSDDALVWMEKHRNSDELQRVLPLIENANTVIQKVNKIIPIVIYLTNRPRTVMEGTKFWLKKHNFPSVDIISRPPKIKIEDGNTWKAGVLEYLYPQIEGIIDDNPNFANKLSKNYKGVVFLYENVDHPREDINIVACPRWENVLKRVEEYSFSNS